MNDAALSNHIKHLEDKHSKLEKKLTEAERIHATDAEISFIEKEKLALKDEIERNKKILEHSEHLAKTMGWPSY